MATRVDWMEDGLASDASRTTGRKPNPKLPKPQPTERHDSLPRDDMHGSEP